MFHHKWKDLHWEDKLALVAIVACCISFPILFLVTYS